LKKLIVLVLLLAGCGYAGSQGYGWWNDAVYRPVASHSQPVPVHIAEGASPDDIAAQLYAKGLIRSKEAFTLYVRYTGARSQFQAGDFTLDKDMTMAQMVDRLSNATPTQLKVRLVEGDTMQQMAQSVQGAAVGSAQDYLAAARASLWQTQYDFLQGRPAGAADNLEGFLFPDTYRLSPSEGPRGLVKRQLDRFGQVVTPDLRAQVAQAVPGRPAESLWNVLILASIVEREVNKDPDRAIACGIFYNRLAAGITLGSDVTVLYGLGQTQGQLSTAQLSDPANPYNTRVHKGLPPGPIANPSLASITACASPQKSNYYYFFVDKSGTTRYARNSIEFQQQVNQFGLGTG
jgi:UPF0755 protein